MLQHQRFYTIRFKAQIHITLVAPNQISNCPFKIVLVGTFAGKWIKMAKYPQTVTDLITGVPEVKPAYPQLWRSSVDSAVHHITTKGLCAVLQNIMKTIIITVKWNWCIHCSSQCLWHIELLDVWLNVSENGSEWSPTVWQSDNCVIFFFFSGAICFTVCNILMALYHILLFLIFFLLLHSIIFIVVKLCIFPMCGTDKGFKKQIIVSTFFQFFEFWKPCGCLRLRRMLPDWWQLIPKIYTQWVRICRIN